MSEMVKVYFYRVPNPDTGEIQVPARKATVAAISQFKGQIVTETEEEVAQSALDQDGHYDPAIGDRTDEARHSVAEKPPGTLA